MNNNKINLNIKIFLLNNMDSNGKLIEFHYENKDKFNFSKFYDKDNLVLRYKKDKDCITFNKYKEFENEINLKKYVECREKIKYYEFSKSKNEHDLTLKNYIEYDLNEKNKHLDK